MVNEMANQSNVPIKTFNKNPSFFSIFSWVRTAMMKERKGPLLESERLLVRGVEQKFINANVSADQIVFD